MRKRGRFWLVWWLDERERQEMREREREREREILVSFVAR